jgi:hypothetical protein
MAQYDTVTLTAGVWTQLTDADASSITFQNLPTTNAILVKATTDGTAPTTIDGAVRYLPGQGERNVSLADLTPGLTGADRLWALSDAAATVAVSHA